MIIRSIFVLSTLIFAKSDSTHTISPKKAPNERLVPIGSTTALMCEPNFSHGGIGEASTWHKNGQKVAEVDSHSNAIYLNRSAPDGVGADNHKMPKIGFLIIYNVSKEDAGIYWCRRNSDGVFGEVFRLDVAFVDEMMGSVELEPMLPILGQPMVAQCPIPNAFPMPKVTWTVNSLPISHISSDFQSFQNGTLIIAHFSYHHFGLFECHVSNFAGKSSAKVFVDVRQMISAAEPRFFVTCSAALRNSLFMFLMGCLVTSAAVLLYLGCAVLLLKPGRTRRVLRPTFWSRTDPHLAPGFRKAVVPLPDCFVNTNSSMLLSRTSESSTTRLNP